MDTLTRTPAATLLEGASSVVVKVGSALLVNAETGALREEWLQQLAADLAELIGRGQQVAVVSSGAVALGRGILKLKGDLGLEQAQAAASVGQQRLAAAWNAALAAHGLTTGQVLLTLADTQNRRRYLNGRATINTLMNMGVVPIVNENDTVATDEIRFGDNDRLAARVALMAGAELLVLLSDVDGLYSANPRQSADARHFPEIGEITSEIEAMAGAAGTPGAKGGMQTKLIAAKTAMKGGCAMMVALGTVNRPLRALQEGARATIFRTEATPADARKAWIAGMKPMGALHVDAGAVAALRNGKSLLPAGVIRVDGQFQRGDPVSILGPEAESIGAALSAYNNVEAVAIAGQRSGEISSILGYPGRKAIAHRDDMVIWGS